MSSQRFWYATAALLVASLVWAGPTSAQVLEEDFDDVSETGGGEFFSGSGASEASQWDDGIDDEKASAETSGKAAFGSAVAEGSATSGTDGSGAGILRIVDVIFDMINEAFTSVTGDGGGMFLEPNGDPNTFGFTLNWDDGIEKEGAFAGTFDGAIVVGGVSAEGRPNGGSDGAGGGRIDVDNIDIISGNWFAGMQWDLGSFPGAVNLANPGFEDGAVGYGAADWEVWGNAYTENFFPRTGSQHAKIFGAFPGTSGYFQSLPAAEGQVWEIDAYTAHVTGDSLVGGNNSLVQKIEFFNAAGDEIDAFEETILDGSSPEDEWIDNAPTQLTAPEGTVEVRAVILFIQNEFEGGAALIDDVSFRQVGGPPNIDLENIDLTVQIRGRGNRTGEQLGDVQFRLEDADGDRLIFSDTATGSWQGLGGTLSDAVEANSDGLPEEGAFDVNTSNLRAVVAFDNEATTAWGTGGRLDVDDLVLTNDNRAGSDWSASLFWDNLEIALSDLNRVFVSADVAGDVEGGEYELKVEGLVAIDAGINETFTDATGEGGGFFFDFDNFENGETFGFTNDWDTGVNGEGAFGGVFGDVQLFEGSGFSAQALTDGGTDGNGSGEILVDGIGFGPGGGWFAGLDWGNQGLASANLGDVRLRADIRGEGVSGGPDGDYELRIEDAQGDRMFFAATANGDWQDIGGFLDTAEEGGELDGGGDGNFDLDSPIYTVAISFIDPETTWANGGRLEVDNLFLTPVQTKQTIGFVSFKDIAASAFNKLGGLFSVGDSTFGDTSESFEGATGTGGGEIYDSSGGGIIGGIAWDDGLVAEEAFAGVWGNGEIGTVTVQACTDCGVDGSKAAQLAVDGTFGARWTGGWWSGLVIRGLRVNFEQELEDIQFTAMVKGTADGDGQTLGRYTLRLEDDQTDFLAFDIDADGDWQEVGGPLSDAIPGSTPDGDGQFDFNQETYAAVLVFVGPYDEGVPDWAAGGTLTLDNLFLSGVSLADADEFKVSVSFDNALTSWDTAGELIVDNLVVVAAGNTDNDKDVDIKDYARFQQCFAGDGGGVPSGCEDLDLNSDGNVDLEDHRLFLLAFEGPGS